MRYRDKELHLAAPRPKAAHAADLLVLNSVIPALGEDAGIDPDQDAVRRSG